MKHLLSLKDYFKEEIVGLIQKAREIKASPENYLEALKDKTLIMLFQKTSTRTRLSFEAAMTQLGGHAIYLDARTTQLSIAGTEFKDEIKSIMGFSDVLMFRALKFADVELAASLNKIPVIDACSEKYHPCQALGDLLTMTEHSGGIDKIKKVVWLGMENNVCNTLKLTCAKLGIDIYLVVPEVDPTSIDEELNQMAEDTGYVYRTLDFKEALNDADYVHTDTWLNMEFFREGKVKPEFHGEYDRRVRVFKPYQLNVQLIDQYCPKAKIMHCMPCHVGYEISRDTIDHPNSIIFDQSVNRLHIQKAILMYLMGK